MRNSNILQRFIAGLAYAFSGKQLATIQPTWKEGQAVYSPVSFPEMVKSGYRKNELIYACISKTANSSAQVNLQVENRNGDILEDHRLRQLIKRPNPFMSEFDFWSVIVIYQKLAGVAYFEKVRSAAGLPVQLWPLRPDWVKPIASSVDFIGGYEYTVPGNRPEFIDAADIIRFPLYDPLDMYNGWPPAAVAGRVGDIDNTATDYLKLLFEKGGTPPGILKTKQRLIDEQVTEIRQRWRDRYGGIKGWLDPAVLDSDAEYQRIGLNVAEMGFEILDARNEARICTVMAVPPILVGAKIGLDRSTYSNYREARTAWWQDDLLPMYANYQDVIDNQLSPEFGDDIRCSWNFRSVYALQEDQAQLRKDALEGMRSGGMTVNEYREIVGLENSGPAGDVFLRTLQQIEIPIKTVRKSDPLQLETKAAGNAPDDDTRRKHEKLIATLTEEFLQEQLKRAIKDAKKQAANR